MESLTFYCTFLSLFTFLKAAAKPVILELITLKSSKFFTAYLML
jgi:hypothetical protein